MGETSRGIYQRQDGHIKQYKGKKKNGANNSEAVDEDEEEQDRDGFMYRHAAEKHGGARDLQFEFKRTASTQDSMRRVILESVQILNKKDQKGVRLLNGKGEYFGLRVVTPEFGFPQTQD